MRHQILTLAAIAALVAANTAYASTFTLTGSQLAGVNLSVPAVTIDSSTGSATYAGGQITLSSGDNVGGGGSSQFFDTAQITVANGFDGASLGTLNQLFTSGLSFDLASMTPGSNLNDYAYFNVIISNGVNTYQCNSYSDNKLGTNGFDTGNGTSVSACTGLGNLFQAWSTFATTYGGYNVQEISIDVGGWDSGTTQTGVIDSITLPGTFAGAPAPEPASLALLGAGLAGLGFARRRRKV